MFLKLIALLLCIAYASCQEYVRSVDCANNTVHSRNVQMEVSGCKSTDERCPLFRGTNHTVVFTFEPTMDFMNKTDGRVYGVFDSFTVPYGKKTNPCEAAISVNDDSSCLNHGGFKANHVYKHTSKFAVSKNYPMIQLKVRFMKYDRRTKMVLLCSELPVEIKENPNSPSDETTDNNEA